MTSARVWGNRKPFRVEKNHFKVEEKKMLKKKNVAFHLEAKKNKKSNCSYWPLFFVVVVVVVVHFQLHYRRCSRYRRRDWDARRPTIGTLRSVGLFCSFLFCFFCFSLSVSRSSLPSFVTKRRPFCWSAAPVKRRRRHWSAPWAADQSGNGPIRKRTNPILSLTRPIRQSHSPDGEMPFEDAPVPCFSWVWQVFFPNFHCFFLLGFTVFFSSFTRFYWVLLGCIGFYWVLLSFTGFYLVLLGSTRF